MANATVQDLLFRIMADTKSIQDELGKAEASVNKFGKSAVNSIDQTTTSTMRNWRESNRMSGSLNGLALSMGGANKTTASFFGVLDNLGDYFERANIRGESFGKALKNLTGEMSMMVTGGIIAAAAFAFKALMGYIADMNKHMDATNKLWSEITIMGYEQKLKKLEEQYKNNEISASKYLEKAKELNELLIKEKYAVGLNKLTEEYDKLDKTLYKSRDTYNPLIIAQQGWNAVTGMGSLKLSTLQDEIAATTVKMQKEIKAINDNTTATVKNTEAKKLAERVRLGPDIPKGFFDDEKKRAKFGSEIDDMILEHRQNTMDQIADYEEKKTQDSTDKIQGYYNAAAASLANATVSSLTSGIQAWRDWAKNVIAEIERVILKQLFLNAITAMFGAASGGGGIFGAIVGAITGSKAGAAGGSSGVNIIPLTGNISAEGQLAFVKFTNSAYGNATPKAQAQLYRNVQRGQLNDTMR